MDIISEIRNAPEEGAKRLEREYKARLMAVAMNLCGDKSEVEALVYDTMGIAVSQIESLSKPESFFSWMCSILTNTYSKSTRRMSNEKVVYTDSLPDSEDAILGEESVLEPIDGAILRDAVNELPEKLRESVILRYFMDMPLLQMAKFLAIPVGTVNSRLHLARKALAARLGPTGRKSVVAVLAALAFLGATAALWVGGAFDGDEAEMVADSAPSSHVSRLMSLKSGKQASSESQPTEETKEAKAMNMKATTAIVAAALVFPASYGGVQATGGTFTIDGSYAVHTFTNSGTFTVTQGGGRISLLVVGGGGGGGSGRCGGGGGGAGGVVYTQEVEVAAGDYAVTVGAGGAGAQAAIQGKRPKAESGGASSFIGGGVSITANGGGRGGTGGNEETDAAKSKGVAGGSGGGAGGYWVNDGGTITVPSVSGMVGQGNAGGSSTCTAWHNCVAGGGGGAGAAGGDGVPATTYGNGGIGIACSISGEEKWYAGGGGGGGSRNTGAGSVGPGGGGAGARVTLVNGTYGSDVIVADGDNATPNTGGGGGGASGYVNVSPSGKGGDGGSGIVIVRYFIDTNNTFDEIIGGTKTRDGEYEVHTFTNSGTLHVSGCSLVDLLVVGGGGGGGAATSGGGGGGAGGVVYKQGLAVLSGDYEIVVGEGGTGGIVDDARKAITTSPVAGAASSALGFTAKGGGPGGITNGRGGSGASGGGGAAYTSTDVFKSISGGLHEQGQWQGNDGGASTNFFRSGYLGCSGGGGGAGEAGHDGVIDATRNGMAYSHGGEGGDGIACSITGEEKWYGGGGAGGMSTFGSANQRISGGNGGGGKGAGRGATVSDVYSGGDGDPNTGGGGGGGGGYSPLMANGGNGGSGVVIIRCKRIKKGTIVIVQ